MNDLGDVNLEDEVRAIKYTVFPINGIFRQLYCFKETL